MQYSFLVSLYRHEKPEFLDECLRSLSLQTIPASETILVFDGPITEKLEEVVEKWREPLAMTIVRLEKNMGLGLALNKGLLYCSNEIVARADTDDVYRHDRMEKQLAYLRSHPDCLIIGANIIEFNKSTDDAARVRVAPETSSEIFRYLKTRNPFNHASVVFKRDFIISIGGYVHHLYMEDYNLWIRALAQTTKVHNIQENLVYVRVGDGMVGRRKGIPYIKSEYALFNLMVEKRFNTKLNGFAIFCARSASRLMPNFLLEKLYRFLRSSR